MLLNRFNKLLFITLFLAVLPVSSDGQGCGMLCNTDFESNPVTGIYPGNVQDSLVPCWSTTAPDNIFEFWGTPNYESVPAYSGSTFIELNANYASTLYQTFVVNPGTNINITFAHRGRWGTDQMAVEFGNAGGPYANLGNFSTGTAWTLYTINYTVPATASGPQELRFTSVSTSSGNTTVGNFLDAIDVSYVISGVVNSTTDITCNGGNDGAIDISAVGGFPPITYDMGGPVQSNGVFTNLSAGTQVVTMTDSNGCQYTVDTILYEPPAILIDTVSMTASTCGFINGAIEVYADLGVPPYQYSIDGGATWQGSGVFPGLAGGTYSIEVTDANLCTNTQTFVLPEVVSTVLTVNDQQDITCNGFTDGLIDVSASSGVAPYTFDAGSGAQPTGLFSNLSAGLYTVTVADANGCVVQTDILLTEPQILSASTVIVDETCVADCMGSVATAPSGGTQPYLYSLDSGLNFVTTNLFDSLCAGSYDLVVTDSNGCVFSDSVDVLVGGPYADATVNPVPDFCANDPVYGMTGAEPGGSWSGPAITTAGQFDPKAAGAGQFTVQYLINTICPDSQSYTITVLPLPEVDFTSDKVDGCNPVVINFAINDPGIVGSFWNLGNGSTTNSLVFSTVYDVVGTYDIFLTVTDTNGCSDSALFPDYVSVYPNPVADFSFGPQPTTVSEPLIHFTDHSIIPDFWDWDFAGLGTSTQQDPDFSFLNAGSFDVTLVVTTVHGCVDSTMGTVGIDEELYLFIPNAFTPNDDGINDFFKVTLNRDYGFGFELRIFDRWGHMVFKTDNPDAAWTGEVDGEMAKSDIYIWQVILRDEFTHVDEEFKGHVTVLR